MANQQTPVANRVRPFGQMLKKLRQVGLCQRSLLEPLLPRGWPENHGAVWRLRGAKLGVAAHGGITELNQIPKIQ